MMANVLSADLAAVRLNWFNFSAVIFFSGVMMPVLSNRLNRVSFCASKEKLISRQAVAREIGLGFILNIRSIKNSTNT